MTVGAGNPEARRAKLLAAVGALIVVPIMGVAWYVVAIVINLAAGATVGGYGAAPEGGDAWWATPALILAATIALLVVVWTIRAIHRAASASARR
jgi:hypothetical protein